MCGVVTSGESESTGRNKNSNGRTATPKSMTVIEAEFFVLPGNARQIVPNSAACFIKQIRMQSFSDCLRESATAAVSEDSPQTIHRPLDNIGISSIQIARPRSIFKLASLILKRLLPSINFTQEFHGLHLTQ